MLEHDELDSLLNGIDWDQPLSPLDLDLPTDPDVITLLSSSSPISPVALPNQPPNPLVDKFLQSLTNAPIQFTDYPATPQQESRVSILLPSLCESKAQSTKAQSGESQSYPSSPRRLRSNSTVLGTPTQDARVSLSRPNRFQRNQILKQKRRESRCQYPNFVRRPRYNACLHYRLTNAFSSWEIIFWDYKRQSTPSRTLPYRHRGLWCHYLLLKYSPSNDTKPTRAHIQANNLFTSLHNISP